jgi:hypothetical protein
MEKFTIKYKDFMYEKLEDQFKDKLQEKYQSLQRGCLDLLDKSVKQPEELVNVQNFISEYISNPDKGTLVEFVENNDIFNFYLKYQADIDELCNEEKFYDDNPSKNNVYSLYDFIISGTKLAVLKCMEMLKEMF